MARPRKTLLCIDDHEAALAGWCLYLQQAGYSVQSARTAQEGLQIFATQPVDLVLLDYLMPEMNGAEVATTMKHMKPDVRIVLFTGALIDANRRAKIDAVIEKGTPPSVLLQRIQELLEEQ